MTRVFFTLFLLLSPLCLAADDTLFLELELSPQESVYAQTPITCSIRLYRSVQVVQGTLTEVTVNDPDAMVERLGEDREYEHYDEAGRRYAVLERRYVVTAQRIGELLFSPIVFEGRVLIGERTSFLRQTQTRTVASEGKNIVIKPLPASFQTHNWLPANDVTLQEEWSQDPTKAALGEPITWTLTITAQGCLASHIPDVALTTPGECKYYQEKPQVENIINPQGFTGIKKIKAALIPTKAGTVSLPEIKVKWWNLKDDKEQAATLKGTTLQVDAGVLAMDTTPQDDAFVAAQQSSQPLPLWAWALIGLNSIWIVLLGMSLYKKIPSRPNSKGNIRNKIKKACLANDAKQVQTHLLTWAALSYPEQEPRSLIQLKKELPEAMQAAIDDLYQTLYGHKTSWDGTRFWHTFKTFQPKKRPAPKKAKTTPLQQLYN